MAEKDELDPNYPIVLQIQASNRTTFAVRGLLRFLVITAFTRLIGGVLAGLAFGLGGFADPNGFLLFLGIAVIAAGEVWSAFAANQELKNSEVEVVSVRGILRRYWSR